MKSAGSRQEALTEAKRPADEPAEKIRISSKLNLTYRKRHHVRKLGSRSSPALFDGLGEGLGLLQCGESLAVHPAKFVDPVSDEESGLRHPRPPVVSVDLFNFVFHIASPDYPAHLAPGLVFCSVDLDESGGGFRAEGFFDLFAVGIEVLRLGREIFFFEEVVPHHAVRVEFVFSVLVGHKLLICHAELFDVGLASEPAEHIDELAIAVSPLDPATDADFGGGLFAVGVEEVAFIVSEEGPDVFAAGDCEACLEHFVEFLGFGLGFGFEQDFDEAVVCHDVLRSAIHAEVVVHGCFAGFSLGCRSGSVVSDVFHHRYPPSVGVFCLVRAASFSLALCIN